MRPPLRRLYLVVGAIVAMAAAVGVAWLLHSHGPDELRNWVRTWRQTSQPPPATARAAAPVPLERLEPALRRTLGQALRDPVAVFGGFDAWTRRYLAARSDAERAALIDEGVTAARERRALLFELIALDPELALHVAVPATVRPALPAPVAEWLEERVSGVGDFRVVAARPPAAAPSPEFRPIRREVVIGESRYDTFVYGRRLNLTSRDGLAVHGVAVDGRLALLDSPIRVLEPGESPAAGRPVEEVCAVSGKPAGPDNATPDEPVVGVDAGDRVYYLCSGGHIALLEESLRARENAGGDGTTATGGPAVAASADLAYTTGNKRLLIIRVRFADQAPELEPQSTASVQSSVAEAGAFLGENAFGGIALEPTVTPVYTLPQTAAWYQSHDGSGYALNVLQAARDVAAHPQDFLNNSGLAAFNYLDYDFEAVRYTGGPGAFTGQAYVGVRGLWLKSSGAGVLAHELGHNLGLWHANFWEPSDPQALTGAGNSREYGDAFDTMGDASAGAWHFNTYEKHELGWLADGNVESVFVSGVFRLYAHDLGGVLDPARRYALRIPRDADRDYWFEFRQHPGWAQNPWLTQGLGVRWDPWAQSNGGTQLLDATPLSASGKTDSAVLVGRTFADPAAHLFVTPLARGGTSPESLDVDVRIGPFPNNHAPAAALTASAETIAVGGVVSFSATASDPDGDALAFAWDFGDAVPGVNAASATHAWAQPGAYRVRLVASDRQGGTASASVVVRVGNAGGALLRGTIVDLAGAPVPDVRVAFGAPGDANRREALTDSDGTYVLTGVAPATATLTASKPGWQFAPAVFANPVAVSGDRAQLDFAGCAVGWRISGMVRYADGTPAAGVLVSDGTRTEPTGADGSYTLVGVPAGVYVLQASKAGFAFAPVPVEVAYANLAAPTLSEVTYTLSGRINGGDGTAVTVTDGWRITTAYASGAGSVPASAFTLSGVPAGQWNLQAWQAGTNFVPGNFSNPLVVAGDRFDLVLEAAGAASGGTIRGRVTERGEGLAGVTVRIDGVPAATTDTRGTYQAAGLAAGTHAVAVSLSGTEFNPAERSVVLGEADANGIDFASTRTNAAPRITQAARATAPYNRPFVKLSVRADDDGGAERLRCFWSALAPSPAPVTFSVNGAQAARDTVASFTAAGTYHVRATVIDVDGASTTSDVSVTVQPLLAWMEAVPAVAEVAKGAQQAFALNCLDQFGNPMAPPAAVAWSVSGGGSISGSGVFTATSPGTGYVVTARAADRATEAVIGVNYPPGPGYGLTVETWANVDGTQVRDLTGLAAYPAHPTSSDEWVGSFEFATGGAGAGGYGRRARGYFVPPATGDYFFAIAAGDAGEFWLATGADPATKSLIASAPVPTGERQWTALASQRSAAVHLAEGMPVYFEALQKAGGTTGHLSVAVTLPGDIAEGPIPGHRLLPWGAAAYPAPRIVAPAQASPATVGSDLSTSVSVLAASDAGEANLTYTWSVVDGLAGPAVFLPNGTHEAKDAVVHFAQTGRYTLRVRVTDPAGQRAESTVVVNVSETLATWRHRFFTGAELDNPALAGTRWGDQADPDGDGVVNLLEYAFDLNPLAAGTEGTPVPGFVTVDGTEYLAITFHRNTAATDVVFTPQASSDLNTWEIGLVPMGDPNAETVTYRDFGPAGQFARRFLRVQVTGP